MRFNTAADRWTKSRQKGTKTEKFMRYYKTGAATTGWLLLNQERKGMKKACKGQKVEAEVDLICLYRLHPSSLPGTARLVSVNRHPLLRTPAQLPVGRRGDGPAASCSARLLEGQQLLSAEGLVVNLRGGLDQVLEVCTREKVAQVDEFTVSIVLNYRLSVYEKEVGRR